MSAATCQDEAVHADAATGGERREGLGGGTVYFLHGDPPIPVRRYGSVPPPPEAEWEIEPADAGAPGTIAEYGGTVVLVAGLLAAAVAGWLIFLP